MIKVGDRVGAIISQEDGVIYFAGYGVYCGKEVPPVGITFMGMDLHELGHENPKIKLDNGHTIWGCQCWWGPEEQIKPLLDGTTVKIVDPGEYSLAESA